MKVITEMSIKDLKKLGSDLFPEMTEESIVKLPINTLQSMIIEKLEKSNFFEEDDEEIKEETDILTKHCPSRKKKANRMKKKYRKIKYNKGKKGDWAKHSRKKIKDSETTNRSFINKASRSYTPNRRQRYVEKI